MNPKPRTEGETMGKKLQDTIARIPEVDHEAAEAARHRQDTLTKPLGSLGMLEELSIKIAGITGNSLPRITRKAVIVMAADHGVVAEGVSAYPQEVTPQMVYNFIRGGAGINVLARHVGAKVFVVDMGIAADIDDACVLVKKINHGTKSMAKGPAMTRVEAVHALEAGIDVVEHVMNEGADIIGTGDMGIGNTTPSSAVTSCITQRPVEEVTGRGTGIDDDALNAKIAVINTALRVNRPNANDAIDVLSKVGGFELGGIAGVILGAAVHRVPVVIDGFISGAAALIAALLSPKAKDYMIAAHRSFEPGHRAVLEWLDLKPLMNLDLRLGEGTGAALGITFTEAACKLLTEMATFEDAHVSEARVDG